MPGSWDRPEAELNRLLRGFDWRFLLRQADAPRAVDRRLLLRHGLAARAAGEGAVFEPAEPGTATLVLADPRRLPPAPPGSEVHLRLRGPGLRRVRRQVRAAGFEDVRAWWSWPPRSPQVWLPADDLSAVDAYLRRRPPGGPARRIGRLVWRAAARAGVLFPLTVIARRPGPPPAGEPLDPHPGEPASWVLLTGGHRSINKVVALRFGGHADDPRAVVKVARTDAAAAGLAREAAVLRRVAADLPAVTGVPRVLATGRRAGCAATAQTAVHGDLLIATLTPTTLPALAATVGDWLAGLVTDRAPRPVPPMVAAALERFEHDYAPVLDAATRDAVRDRVGRLPDLPRAVEHRDCSPWNVLLTADGPALLDWESAEPDGLPLLDLAYFLTMSAFILDGAFDSGRTRESHERLLDLPGPGVLADQATRLGIPPATVADLRLVAWVVHAGPEADRIRGDAGGTPDAAALERGTFLGLIRAELAATSPAALRR